MNLVVSAWSAISPFGYGRDAFAEGVTSRRNTAAPVGSEWSVPDDLACVVPDFDPRKLLGNKGTRAMNRVSGLAVATAGKLIEDTGLESGDHTGFVLGTTTGSAQSMMDFTRASLEGEQPFHVEPANVPSCVMNCAAGQVAIWHQLTGPNATIAAGRATGLVALNYARRLLLTGRARQVLCGVAEEYSNARSWLEHHRRVPTHDTGQVMGEGCAMVLLEPAGTARRPLATLLAVDSQMCLDGDVEGAVKAVVQRLLTRSGSAASQVWATAASTAGGPEQAALHDLFGGEVTTRVPSGDLIGDTSAASALFQVLAVLSVAGADPRSAGGLAVVTAAADDESVVSALFQLRGGCDD
jgi:3-oxoacyl-[acyl-carrier-protein] synthase II